VKNLITAYIFVICIHGLDLTGLLSGFLIAGFRDFEICSGSSLATNFEISYYAAQKEISKSPDQKSQNLIL
jgi:hypothetical protein